MGDSDVKAKRLTVPSADADYIATTQTPGAAGNLTLTGTAGSIDPAAKVTITSDGNESGTSFTVTGLDMDGAAQTETITGPNATTVTGTLFFSSVTQVAIGAAGAGNITVGTAAGGVFVIGGAGAGRCRLRGITYSGGGSDGTLSFRNESNTGTVLFSVDTADATVSDVIFPGRGILFKDGCYVDITSATITGATVFYEGP